MAEERKIRDPIHGFVSLLEKEVEILDTPVFQRLRKLRQLALAYLVYPCALHTRFEHSLGVCHIAGLIAKALRLNEDERNLVRMAALLHDLGHGPFSHVSEDALQVYADQEKLSAAGIKTEKIHELITGQLICAHPDLNSILSQRDRKQISTLLSSGYGDAVLRSIISGPLDADKQDYLLRDSHYCGVKYGVFDLHQFHEVLKSVDDPADGRHLMVATEGIHALEQFVLAKYYLTTQVVRHRIRLITDQMLLRGISLGIDCDHIDELHQIYNFDGTQAFIERYTKWNDDSLIETFSGEQYKGTACHAILSRLRHRRLFKRVYEAKLKDLSVRAREGLVSISKPSSRESRRELEIALFQALQQSGLTLAADHGSDPSRFVIVHSYTIKSVKEQALDDEGSIPIWRVPQPVTFDEESTLFKSINEKLNETLVEVYAPVTYETPAERRELQRHIRTPLAAAIEGWANRE